VVSAFTEQFESLIRPQWRKILTSRSLKASGVGRSTIAASAPGVTMDDQMRQSAVSALDFELICCAYRKLVSGRHVDGIQARALAMELICDLTDVTVIDPDIVQHIIDQSVRVSDL
jgi:hypothetical protein